MTILTPQVCRCIPEVKIMNLDSLIVVSSSEWKLGWGTVYNTFYPICLLNRAAGPAV